MRAELCRRVSVQSRHPTPDDYREHAIGCTRVNAKNEVFRREHLPYLVPLHCLFYLVHMVQEHVYDIYKHDESATTIQTTTKKEGVVAQL